MITSKIVTINHQRRNFSRTRVLQRENLLCKKCKVIGLRNSIDLASDRLVKKLIHCRHAPIRRRIYLKIYIVNCKNQPNLKPKQPNVRILSSKVSRRQNLNTSIFCKSYNINRCNTIKNNNRNSIHSL